MRGFAEASYEMTDAALGDKNDDKLLVKFGMFPKLNTEKSAQEGRPIYEEVLYVMIMIPGDKESIVHRPAWEPDYTRFPRQYAAFKNKQSQEHAAGTPLKVVSFLTQGQVRELEHFNCYTVEQLANLADAHTGKFMGLQKMKQHAQDYLQAAKETAPLTAMRAELDQRDAQLAAASEALKEQGARIAALEKLLVKSAEAEEE